MISETEKCGCTIVEEGPSLVNSAICSGSNSTLLFMLLLEGLIWGRCNVSTPCKRIESVKETDEEYDFIVVGAGTAGSIVAGRLTENPSFNVLLLEAGGPEPVGVRIPSFYRAFWDNPQVDWQARTVPNNEYCLDQEGLGCKWPVGKGLGGTSQLNGMMYHRGHAADYDAWVKAGAVGWSWDELKPFMDMAEGNKQIGTHVDERYHSATGRMPIQHYAYQPPALQDLLKAIEEAGIRTTTDINDLENPEGFGPAQCFNHNGQRYTTARAYLSPKSETPNLSVKLRAHVTKVLFDGTRAYGVEYVDAKGNTKTVNATKEVILSAGALGSPKILMHSGVGPTDVLEPLEIPVIVDLPVGKALKNHCGATLYFVLTKVNNTAALDWKALLDFLLTNKGPMTSTGLTQLTGLLYSSKADKKLKQPDLQFFFNGLYAECSKTGVIGEQSGECPYSSYNISANAVALLPRSTGWMTINSTNPFDQALYYPNFFSHPDDMEMIKEGLDYLHRIFDSELMQNKYGVKLDPEYTGGCDQEAWSDEWKECMIRLHTDPQNHQLATCAIGTVIDPQLKVKKLEDIRVCDAGSMPSQPTGNPQGAIMAVAERCAHFIKEAWQ